MDLAAGRAAYIDSLWRDGWDGRDYGFTDGPAWFQIMSGAFVADVGVEALVDVDAEDLVASLTEGVTPAVETAEEVEHPQRVAASRLERLGAGERYRVWVSEDGSVLGLWRGGRRTNPPVSCRVTEGPWR